MEGNVDVIVLGTGLTESITAAALSKAGYKVAHIDTNPYYGGDEASLSLDELVNWANDRSSSSPESPNSYIEFQKAKFTSISQSPSTLAQSRQYALSLAPSLIPSLGPIISSLVSSGVARYGGYRLVERVGVYDISGTVKAVPGSKEDIFKNKDISLVDKRRLMRFLMFAAGEFEGTKELEEKTDMAFLEFLKASFSLNEEIAKIIAYSLAYCVSATDPTLPALLRVRNYLRSSGRYGTSSFIVGHYGGSGEIAQGFCRTAAVAGAIYVLGRRIASIAAVDRSHTSEESPAEHSAALPTKYSVELEDLPEKLTCNLIISSPDHVPLNLLPNAKRMLPSALPSGVRATSVARCIAIIDKPIYFSSPSPHQDPSASVIESIGNPSPSPDAADAPARQHIDTAALIFPPSSLSGGSTTAAVHALITGEGSMSTPSGKWIVYLSMPLVEETSSSPETILKPYLDATLSLATSTSPVSSVDPLFTTYYIQNISTPPTVINSPQSPSETPHTVLITPSPSTLLPEASDSAATNSEAVFWEAVRILKSLRSQSADPAEWDEVQSFWPAVEADPEEEREEEW